ncbi:hypothetical protein [Flavobacterium taihuense]|uniref:Uncharacterized protein n=1 Tax=Flavobacterium taihuense TaxID=2857508 RepID=A0ABS6XZL2_9FLAO|nr:hypothetical protein [Flavobacterium taihuense]MBW4362034.1 hypothetical protein [Flavobacterium taihuense]
MKKKINSIQILLGMLLMVTVFHFFIMVKLIPYDIAWGGRLTNDTEMYGFEAISIFINLFLISVLSIRANYLKFRVNKKVINSILWIFFFLFILNTIGNLSAKSYSEKLFSVFTLILALLIWNVLKKKATTNC